MPRYACKRDANHDLIASTFRAHGIDWIDTWQHAQYTPGFPDGIAVYGPVVRFIEVKAHEKAMLTQDEALFRSLYADVYRVVATVEEACAMAEEMRRGSDA